ncbi:C40 family peptidase [Mycobacteroides abscessus]|uniref:C40 family peptidase n=1 Tax=Mycobacteroides abscessus TaxID=36809 RepID=UPI00092B7C21|nr:NlpC/P60 family protein [Mycobacteroides abscessus]SIA36802.1 NLP/P60 protein [Mycobacteroides abscessus subsp. abscessus]SIA40539.1 NLP/P60 protein [Mycobacteroides abscessus subsp. abscessus]SIA52520.1 NLP/P60 protein [Mycobacteroides abscessus subsp. abscessus]SIA56462.1 NLP/P60 protein [Mycobacteroides abscessus subsp. abscessus]SIA81916.1 NLP/P60 protein [Mycobacteroides abscessus subsp. abscessus]
MTTCDGVEHWDAEGLQNVIGTMDGIHQSHVKLGDTLDGVQANLESWGGLTAEAWRAYHGKLRVDVDAQGHQAKAVADKLRPLYDEVLSVKSRFRYLKATIENNGHFGDDGQMVHWKLNNDGSIDTGGTTKSADEAFARQQLEAEMKELLHKADGVDQEIADALAAITTPGGAPTVEPHPGQPAPTPTQEPQPDDKREPDPTIAAGALTPADQLPLPAKDGTVPSVTEANARHTGPESGKDYLHNNPRPAPLLAGLSADEWRKRLATYKPGDPLPDPRTPTGDKGIDTIAHAAGQQNATYAWGGNKDKDGPSIGTLQGDPPPGTPGEGPLGGGAHTYQDNLRTGYDCGGLVRYSLEQGAKIDVGQGTNTIDSGGRLERVAPLVPSGNINNTNTQAGNILIFGGSQPWAAGMDTTHTGIYVGNGYMINSPQSGDAVRIDAVNGHGKTDILRIPGAP